MMRVISKPPHSSLEWHRVRHRDAEGRAVFGASEIPALVGVSRYESANDVLLRKLGEPTTTDESPAMRSGNLIEPVVVEEASRVLGVDLVTPDVMFGRGRLVATPDGIDAATAALLYDRDLSAPAAVAQAVPDVWLEVKCTSRYRVKTLEDVPDMWRWQMAAQSYVLDGRANMVLGVLDADLHMSFIDVPRLHVAEETIAALIERAGAAVDSGDVRDAVDVLSLTADEVAVLWRASDATVELPRDAVDWLLELEQARTDKKQAEQREEDAKAWIARNMKDATVGTLDGVQVVTWKEQQGRVYLDTKSLEADHPALVEQYKKQGQPFRVMRTSRKKG